MWEPVFQDRLVPGRALPQYLKFGLRRVFFAPNQKVQKRKYVFIGPINTTALVPSPNFGVVTLSPPSTCKGIIFDRNEKGVSMESAQRQFYGVGQGMFFRGAGRASLVPTSLDVLGSLGSGSKDLRTLYKTEHSKRAPLACGVCRHCDWEKSRLSKL